MTKEDGGSGPVRLAADKPTVPEVRPLVAALYERHGAGCCLHIVLDDGNIEDSDVEYCLRQARQLGHRDCEVLASKLLRMSKTQRFKAGEG